MRNQVKISSFYEDSLNLETLSVENENVKEDELIDFSEEGDGNSRNLIHYKNSPDKFAKQITKKIEEIKKNKLLVQDDEIEIKEKKHRKNKLRSSLNHIKEEKIKKNLTRAATRNNNADILKQITKRSEIAVDL